jgi:hypothetical protein
VQVHAIVSRLIADDGLPASHDQPTGTIVVHHVEPTRLQVGWVPRLVLHVCCLCLRLRPVALPAPACPCLPAPLC